MTVLERLSGDPVWCPFCAGTRLPQGQAVIPGTYALFETTCPTCGRQLLAHYPIGYAAGSGLVLDPATGEVHSNESNRWYATNLASAWAGRRERPVRIMRERFREPRRPLLVNAIDLMFGHCLQKLFDLPRLRDEHPDRDLIVLVQDFARWLVPDGAAEIWSVDIALREGREWFDDLARQVSELLETIPPAAIEGGLGRRSVDIATFTRVEPFDRGRPEALATPRVTFIWRSDRCWTLGITPAEGAEAIAEQAMLMSSLAMTLRQAMPQLAIAVAGIGRDSALPDWVEDHRIASGGKIDELAWLDLYRSSHVVLGVHGSNMLLPAAHAATAIELVPPGKWQHVGDTYDFVRGSDGLQALRNFRFLPTATSPRDVAAVVQVMIRRAMVDAYNAQLAALTGDDERRRFRATYGHVLAYPGL